MAELALGSGARGSRGAACVLLPEPRLWSPSSQMPAAWSPSVCSYLKACPIRGGVAFGSSRYFTLFPLISSYLHFSRHPQLHPTFNKAHVTSP